MSPPLRAPRRSVFSSALYTAALICCTAGNVNADTSAFTITDDPQLDAHVAAARSWWLSTRPTSVSRMNVTVLVPNDDGTWRRGSYGQEALQYPASSVKLGYLAAAMYWCRTNGKAYDFLESSVGPMIRNSDNYQTGVVVDTLSGVPNIPDVKRSTDPRFLPWYNERLYPENFLAGRGLLEDQTMMNKTYPSNNPYEGAEYVNVNRYRGSNMMKSKCAASLMLEIVNGALEPGANAYMKGLLAHDLWGGNSGFGFGLPPGTVYLNKDGFVSPHLCDIAYIRLPNGKELILAAYSDGYESANPSPYDISNLGVFAENLIERLGLNAGNPPCIKVDNDAAVQSGSGWTVATSLRDRYGSDYLTCSKGTGARSLTWNLNVPVTGTYEVCVWYTQSSSHAPDAHFTVHHSGGSTLVRIDQRSKGGRWVRLGDYNFNQGAGSVVLTDQFSGNGKTVVVGDAVKVAKHPFDSITVDNSNTDFSASGNWILATSAADKYGDNYRYRVTENVADPAVFSFTAPATGDYEIAAWWSQGTNRSTAAPYQINHAAGTTTVLRNQQANGGSWQSLGVYHLNAGANTVNLSPAAPAGFVVIADAIRVTGK